ncbi:MAG: DUF805 domain-containing protein [Sutterellaceae bacterium]|nr:DUF805 domain-containing protein [Sutterellaceae bacterium]MDD7442735.1 DUF805 domain-containing protein [Sutterellaceae bacterium]MDY2867305.1 DUF805 domain-containing protein [Mesosutterella sp.]
MALAKDTTLFRDITAWRPEGRLVRSRYAAALVLWGLVAALGAALFCFALGTGRTPAAGTLAALVGTWFIGVASVRRLHDMGRPGAWVAAVFLVPVLGFVPLLITESKPGANRWGENPKGMLRIDDPRLLAKLHDEARPGSVMDEVGPKAKDEGK